MCQILLSFTTDVDDVTAAEMKRLTSVQLYSIKSREGLISLNTH